MLERTESRGWDILNLEPRISKKDSLRFTKRISLMLVALAFGKTTNLEVKLVVHFTCVYFILFNTSVDNKNYFI